MTQSPKFCAGKRVRILSGACKDKLGVIATTEDDREVANILVDQPCEFTTSEEDYDNIVLVE